MRRAFEVVGKPTLQPYFAYIHVITSYSIHYTKLYDYPLLDENAFLVASTEELMPRDSDAEKGKNNYMQCQPPTPGYIEQVFYR